MVKKLFFSKEEFDIDGFEESLVVCREDCDEKFWGSNGDYFRGLFFFNDVIIGLREKKIDVCFDEDGVDDWNGVSFGVVVRFVEMLVFLSDVESDSFSFSDYVILDLSVVEDCDCVRLCNVICSNKVFYYIMVNC